MRTKKGNGLFKKTAAVVLSMVMVMGAVSVMPESVIIDNAIVAHADEEIAANNCIFKVKIVEKEGGESYAVINGIEIMNSSGNVVIPSAITFGDVTYPVTEIGTSVLNGNKEVKTVVVPDSVTTIGSNFLNASSIEKVTLSDNVESIGQCLCMSCPELKNENFIYNGTKLKKIGTYAFDYSKQMLDPENRTIVLGNWLVKYSPSEGTTSVKIADLSKGDVKIDHIGPEGIEKYNKEITTVDLEGIKYLDGSNFYMWDKLTTILNDDDIEEIGNFSFYKTPWYETAQNNGLVRIGKVLEYYKTDNNVVDLTTGKLAGVKTVHSSAFKESPNLDTLICTSDSKISESAFKSFATNSGLVSLPEEPSYIIKTIILDGKKLEFSKENPMMPDWVNEHYRLLRLTPWFKENVEAKTKVLLEQLDITYYGLGNDKIGTLSPTEEFYITLKIHEYMSTFEADMSGSNGINNFMYLGRAQCSGYAELTNYLLECAGVKGWFISSTGIGHHAWNQIKIGDEWFECDMGWDEQLGHNYGWFALSRKKVVMRDEANTSLAHTRVEYSTVWDAYTEDFIKCSDDDEMAQRTLGDLNGDETRDDSDVELLWNYIKGNIGSNRLDTNAADINFDGVVDITDGVLLENFVYGNSVDPKNFPKDALSPGFNVVFADNCAPEDIDPNYFIYDFTDRDGYIVLPKSEFKAPEGMKFGGWDYGKEGEVGKVGEKVKISNPYTVVQPIWKDGSELDDDDSKGDDDSSKGDDDSKGGDDSKPDTEGKWLLGDVDGNGVIDIGDVSMLINHINGVKALDKDAMLRADVNKSNTVDISDASTIVNHINGVKALEGKV